MEAFNILLWALRHTGVTLDEGQSLTVWIVHKLQSWWGYVVGEQAHSLDNRLWIVLGSLCHFIRQIHLELEVSAVVGSAEQHAREVALTAYFFGLDGFHAACRINVFRLHSLSNELRRHQSWFSAIRTSIRLDYANQRLEVLHILCVGHAVGLVVRRNSMLCLLVGIGTVLMAVKAAAGPLDD